MPPFLPFVLTMAHLPRSMSPKERRDAKNARILIGREDQQDLFTRSLLQPGHREAKLIFSISGQGGVGKTTLLKEFRRIAEGHGDVVAYVDEERLMRETQEVLTPLFLEGVGKVAIDKTLVLLLDTYEVTGTFLDEWVRLLLEEQFGELSAVQIYVRTNILFS